MPAHQLLTAYRWRLSHPSLTAEHLEQLQNFGAQILDDSDSANRRTTHVRCRTDWQSSRDHVPCAGVHNKATTTTQ